jgi:hypothetical protein
MHFLFYYLKLLIMVIISIINPNIIGRSERNKTVSSRRGLEAVYKILTEISCDGVVSIKMAEAEY